jgi:hypothetical protein
MMFLPCSRGESHSTSSYWEDFIVVYAYSTLLEVPFNIASLNKYAIWLVGDSQMTVARQGLVLARKCLPAVVSNLVPLSRYCPTIAAPIILHLLPSTISHIRKELYD